MQIRARGLVLAGLAVVVLSSAGMAGAETLPDEGRYEGALREGVRHGHGVLTLPDGTRYKGEFCDGVFHGRGDLSVETILGGSHR